jgi:hypothetical protein
MWETTCIDSGAGASGFAFTSNASRDASWAHTQLVDPGLGAAALILKSIIDTPWQAAAAIPLRE